MNSITIPKEPRTVSPVLPTRVFKKSGTCQNTFLTCGLIVLFFSLAAQKVETLKIIKDTYYHGKKLPSDEELKELGVSQYYGKARNGWATKVQIHKVTITLQCSTKEVAFLFGHFMNHHRHEFIDDLDKFIRFIVNRYGKYLLKIGVAKPGTKKRKTLTERKADKGKKTSKN